MNYKINLIFKVTHIFDLFGKRIGLYYKGNEIRNTYFGSIFSLGFLIIYLAYFLYRLLRLIRREDVVFYDTFEYLEQPPSIQLTNDLLYGGFALEHPISYDPFIDETIYFINYIFYKEFFYDK